MMSPENSCFSDIVVVDITDSRSSHRLKAATLATIGLVTSLVIHHDLEKAVVKLLWLAIDDIEDKRAAQRAKEQAKKAKQGKATRQPTTGGRLVEGAGTN